MQYNSMNDINQIYIKYDCEKIWEGQGGKGWVFFMYFIVDNKIFLLSIRLRDWYRIDKIPVDFPDSSRFFFAKFQ